MIDESHQGRAYVVAKCEGAPEQSGTSAAHALRRLVVEELQLSDEYKRFCEAEEAMLRDQPERRDGDCKIWSVKETMSVRYISTFDFHCRCSHHGQNGDEEASANALEGRHASLIASDLFEPAHDI